MTASEGMRRLHPATLPIRLLAHMRTLLLPGLAVLVLARDSTWEVWLMALFLPSVVYEVIRYVRLRYGIAGPDLVVREGILSRTERHIPLSRIQNLDLEQGPVHRMLGVADARIETAGGSEPEAHLRVISLSAVEDLRRLIFGGRARAAPESEGEPADEALVRLRLVDLLALSVISNQGLALVAVLAGIQWEFELIDFSSLGGRFITRGMPPEAMAAAGVLAVLAGVLALGVLSAVWTVIRLHGFTLTRAGEEFRVQCGLLTRRGATVPRRRIQLVSVAEAPQHRMLGLATVRVETAGGVEEGETERLGRTYFAPLVRRERVGSLLAVVQPGLDLDAVDWKPVHPRAVARRVRAALKAGAAVGAVSAAAVSWAIGWWSLLAGALVWGACVAYAPAEARRWGWATAGDFVLFRSGVLWRHVSAVRAARVQAVSLLESPFDRRWGMATVRVDTAGAGPAGHAITIPYLARDVAEGLAGRLAQESARTALRW